MQIIWWVGGGEGLGGQNHFINLLLFVQTVVSVRKRKLACVSVARQGTFLCLVMAAAGRGFYSSIFGFGQTQHIFNFNSSRVLSIWGCMQVTPGCESLSFICVSSNKSVISVCVEARRCKRRRLRQSQWQPNSHAVLE